jgi:RNA polymerase sigma-70 factor (ECF subfamily)
MISPIAVCDAAALSRIARPQISRDVHIGPCPHGALKGDPYPMLTAEAYLSDRTLLMQNPHIEDQQLLVEARSGSWIAFTEIQQRHSNRLYRKILSITRNHEDAEDALQDTFLRALKGIHAFEGRSQFSTWLTRIAINSALMVVRKRRNRAEMPLHQTSEWGDDTPFFEAPDRAPDPEKSYELKQAREQMLKVLERLDPKSRMAIEIWMGRECSIKELARSLDVSLATAKSRLYRARLKAAHYHISVRHSKTFRPQRTVEMASIAEIENRDA